MNKTVLSLTIGLALSFVSCGAWSQAPQAPQVGDTAAVKPGPGQALAPAESSVMDAEGKPLANTGSTSQQEATECRQRVNDLGLTDGEALRFLEQCQRDALKANAS